MTQSNGNFTGGPRSAAIEISGGRGSVALGIGEKLLAEAELAAELRHAVGLMPTLADLCAQLGWTAAGTPSARPLPPSSNPVCPPCPMLDHVYLSLGPGSFTGLRIAVAVARGLAQAIGCRLVGVPSLDVIAENAPREFRVVVPILDAKRGQVFAARYERNQAGQLVRMAEPALVDPAAFLAEAARCGETAVLGEGVPYHAAAIGGVKGVVVLDAAFSFGRASTVHRLGWEQASRGKFSDPATILPLYIRLPEAEEVWRKKHPER